MLDKLQLLMPQVLGNPEDVADAVLYAVTQPIHINIAEVVRPPRRLNLEAMIVRHEKGAPL